MTLFSLICALLLRTRLPPRKDAIRLVDWAAFTEASLVLYTIAMFLIFWSLYFAFFYTGLYGRGLGMDYQQSINLLLITTCPGFIFRLLPAYLADKLGPLNNLIPMAVLCSIAMFAWNGIDSTPGLYGFAVVSG